MENAVKALLIAGRILLALLLIALAMYVFNSITNSQIYNIMDEQNLRAYNRPFDLYDGDNNVSGSNLKTLFNKIIEHNKNYENDNSMWINVRKVEAESEIDPDINNGIDASSEDMSVEDYNSNIYVILKMGVWTGRRYKVVCSYDKGTGMIACVQFIESN